MPNVSREIHKVSLKDQIVLKQLEDLQIPLILHLAAKVFALITNLAQTKVLKTIAVPIPTIVVDAHSEVKVFGLTAKVRTNTLQTP